MSFCLRPDVDRGPTDPSNIICRYYLGYTDARIGMFCVFKSYFARNLFDKLEAKDVVLIVKTDIGVSVREAITQMSDSYLCYNALYFF